MFSKVFIQQIDLPFVRRLSNLCRPSKTLVNMEQSLKPSSSTQPQDIKAVPKPVTFWQRLYSSVGFQKGYNFILCE